MAPILSLLMYVIFFSFFSNIYRLSETRKLAYSDTKGTKGSVICFLQLFIVFFLKMFIMNNRPSNIRSLNT